MKRHYKDANLQKTKDLENALKRVQADFDNYKKRSENLQADILSYAKADFMAKITPVLDNFSRAFEHSPEGEFSAGIKQIEKQLEDILTLEGLQKIPAQAGIKFDPSLHEAISCEENKNIETDHIITQVESGWQFNNRVIKPAKVRVSKGK